MSHIYHEDTHTHGLCDECPDCQHKARTGQGFDRFNLHRLLVAQVHHTELDRQAFEVLVALPQYAHLDRRSVVEISESNPYRIEVEQENGEWTCIGRVCSESLARITAANIWSSAYHMLDKSIRIRRQGRDRVLQTWSAEK